MAGLYDGRWQKARAAFLLAHPCCVMCEQMGRLSPATVVDHIRPHRGDRTLFWDRANWQPLCKAHHDGAKQQAEKGRGLRGCDADGVPLDPRHPWRGQQ